MNATLREEYRASCMDGFNDSFDANSASPAQKIDDFLTMRMRVGGSHRFAGLHYNHGHRAVVGAGILFRYNPAQMATGKVKSCDILFVNDR